MHFPLQITLGHILVAVLPLAISALGITRLVEAGKDSDRILRECRDGLQAAREIQVALARHARSGREGAEGAAEPARARFQGPLALLRRSVADEESLALLAHLEAALEDLFAGRGDSRSVEKLIGDLAGAQEESLRVRIEKASARRQDGIGLLVVLGATSNVLVLFFGCWMVRNVAMPLDRMPRALDAILAGDDQLRLEDQGASQVVCRVGGAVNQLVDRLQRMESERGVEFLLACAAVEKLLDARGDAGALLTPGKRLVAANERAREMMRARGASFDVVAKSTIEASPSRVEEVSLRAPSGAPLGDLVYVREDSGGPEVAPGDAARP